MTAGGTMRLDLFLKRTCVVRQRSEAKEICDAGAASVNGRAVKAAHEVRAGDTVELHLPRHTLTLRIAEVPQGNVARSQASRYFEILADVPRAGDAAF